MRSLFKLINTKFIQEPDEVASNNMAVLVGINVETG